MPVHRSKRRPPDPSLSTHGLRVTVLFISFAALSQGHYAKTHWTRQPSSSSPPSSNQYCIITTIITTTVLTIITILITSSLPSSLHHYHHHQHHHHHHHQHSNKLPPAAAYSVVWNLKAQWQESMKYNRVKGSDLSSYPARPQRTKVTLI